MTSDAAVRASRPATLATQGEGSPPVGAPKARLLDQVRDAIRTSSTVADEVW